MNNKAGSLKTIIAGMTVILFAYAHPVLSETAPAAENIYSPQAQNQNPEERAEPVAALPVNTPDAVNTPETASTPPAKYPAPTSATSMSTGASLLNVMFGLGFILVLIFALAWLARRMTQGGLMNASHIKVVAALPLGTRERLVVVDVGGQQMLLGITTTNISTLHVFPEPVIDQSESAGQSEFSKKLMTILQQKKSPLSTSSGEPRA